MDDQRSWRHCVDEQELLKELKELHDKLDLLIEEARKKNEAEVEISLLEKAIAIIKQLCK